jgi:crotonobetainyl-CoA:carnitine CoA-transferase CaiB-like acyl-CoA transferase
MLSGNTQAEFSPPPPGEHTCELLAGFGYSDADIETINASWPHPARLFLQGIYRH